MRIGNSLFCFKKEEDRGSSSLSSQQRQIDSLDEKIVQVFGSLENALSQSQRYVKRLEEFSPILMKLSVRLQTLDFPDDLDLSLQTAALNARLGSGPYRLFLNECEGFIQTFVDLGISQKEDQDKYKEICALLGKMCQIIEEKKPIVDEIYARGITQPIQIPIL